MHSRPLPLMLTLDVGPDDAALGSARREAPSWERTGRGLALMADALRGLEDELGVSVPATWFVRADAGIESQLGSVAAVFARFDGTLRRAAQAGHELGWLAQLPADGGARALDDLARVHEALAREGLHPKSTRAGDLRHNDASMAAFDALGIDFDSSALPGRSRRDGGWLLDWAPTPARPYRPSVADYRVPGEPQRRILEVPLSVVPIRAPYDSSPLARYVNPCMHAALLAPALEAVAGLDYLVCLMHPDEVVPRDDPGHPLIAYSPRELGDNLRDIVAACAARGRALSFTTLRDFGTAHS